VQGLIVNLGPGGISIPVILVPHERDVELAAQLFELTQLGSILDKKVCTRPGWQVFPSLPGFPNFPSPDIQTGHVDCFSMMTKDIGKNLGLVGTATGQIEQLQVAFFR